MAEYQLWTPEEDARLKALRERYSSLPDIWHLMPGRTEQGVAKRARALGISFKQQHRPQWPAYMDDLLRHYWNVEGMSAGQIAVKLGISRNAVIGRAHRMGLDARQSPIIRRRKICETLPKTCEFGIGDPKETGFRFCGAPLECGSYCTKHYRVTHSSRKQLSEEELDRRKEQFKRIKTRHIARSGGVVLHIEDVDERLSD